MRLMGEFTSTAKSDGYMDNIEDYVNLIGEESNPQKKVKSLISTP